MQAGGIPHKCCIPYLILLIHPSIHSVYRDMQGGDSDDENS